MLNKLLLPTGIILALMLLAGITGEAEPGTAHPYAPYLGAIGFVLILFALIRKITTHQEPRINLKGFGRQ